MGKQVPDHRRLHGSSTGISVATSESVDTALLTKADESHEIQRLRRMLKTLTKSRKSSDIMLQQLRTEVKVLRRQKEDQGNPEEDDLALVDARKDALKLQQEVARLKQALKDRDDQRHQQLLEATKNDAAVQSEIKRMKAKINKAVRQCARLQQRNTKLKNALIALKNSSGVVVGKSGSKKRPSKSKSKSATSKSKVVPKKKVTKKAPKKQQAPVETESSDDDSDVSPAERGGYSPQMARLMGHRQMENNDEISGASTQSSEDVPIAAQVQTKVPGFFIQESPAEAWRRRKEAQAKKGKSGPLKKRTPSNSRHSRSTTEPGMKAKTGFAIAFPEQDKGVPEFMRKFQKIGMKAPEAVIETSGKVIVSKSVKVGVGGVQLSSQAQGEQKAQAAAQRAEQERLEREKEERLAQEEEDRIVKEAAERREREIAFAKQREEEQKAEEDRLAAEKAAQEAKEKAEAAAAAPAPPPPAAAAPAPPPAAAPAPPPPAAAAPAPPPPAAPEKKKSSFLDSSSDDDSSPLVKKAAPAAAAKPAPKKKSFLDSDSDSDSSSGW